jgi:hypothetical protein
MKPIQASAFPLFRRFWIHYGLQKEISGGAGSNGFNLQAFRAASFLQNLGTVELTACGAEA